MNNNYITAYFVILSLLLYFLVSPFTQFTTLNTPVRAEPDMISIGPPSFRTFTNSCPLRRIRTIAFNALSTKKFGRFFIPSSYVGNNLNVSFLMVINNYNKYLYSDTTRLNFYFTYDLGWLLYVYHINKKSIPI